VTADRLLLWRHGRTASNAGGRFQGQLDVPLDDVGRVQVKDAAELLAATVRRAGPCRIVSSDLSRARDTALALAELIDVPIEVDARLREIDVGRWQGKLRAEIEAVEPDAFAAWIAGDDLVVGGAERRSEAAARAAHAVLEHAARQDGGVLVVASHGAALRGAVLELVGVTPWSPVVLGGMRNAHWADLRRRHDRWTLDGWNIGPPEGSVAPEG
jgi:glucosyl-3-phosphoglycerate phosphatase